jgi:hypothetical protein
VKNIRDWNGLVEFGIIPLTGEADRTGQRMLCDLNDAGKEVLEDLLGASLKLASNYNSSYGAKHSIMLPYSLFNDLAAWCLITRVKCDEVFYIIRMKDECTLRPVGGVTGRTFASKAEWEEHINFLINLGCEIRRIRIRTKHPGEGTRAVHHMSGRVI